MKTPRRLLIFNDAKVDYNFEDIPHDGLEITVVQNGDKAKLLAMIPDYDAYMPTLRVRVDQEVADRAKKLRFIATPSTGTDHLDLALLEKRGVTVQSMKYDREFLNGITNTAELAFGLICTCARHLPICFEASREGRWERSNLAGRQLKDKTLGIIGLGRLGSMMARYGQAFWMRTIGYDPHLKAYPAGVEMVDLPTLLRESDFVTLHVHLTDETRGMLGAAQLAQMKRGSSLINTSRGGLTDEDALIKEMEAGRIASTGIDVINGEWMEDKYNHPLIAYSRKNPRLYITPHVGGTCPEANREAMRHTFKKVVAFFNRPAAA